MSKKNLVPTFRYTPAYRQMESAIRSKIHNYQYFKGLAFYKPDFATNIAPEIQGEIEGVLENLNEVYKYGERYSTTALRKILDEKIQEYEIKEVNIFNMLRDNLIKKQGVERVSSLPLYTTGMSQQEKINIWDRLFDFGLLDLQENEVADFSKDGNCALYCFLMSDELSNYLKNSAYITTVLSRKSWAKAYLLDTAEYSTKKGKKRIERQMWEAFVATVNKQNNMFKVVEQGFSNALDEIINVNKEKYLNIVRESYAELQRKVGKKVIGSNTGYKYLHDRLKSWGAEIFQEVNKQLTVDQKAAGINPPVLLTKVEIGKDGISFFTIENKGEETTTNERLKDGLIQGIINCIDSYSSSEKFSLTVLSYGKRFFSPGTAKAASSKISFLKTNINNAISKYVNSVGVQKLSTLKSNSIINGILGELAVALRMQDFGINGKITGGLQQYYKSGGSKLSSKKLEGWKSSGQAYSDYMYSGGNGEESFGINIKRYITDKNVFTLTSFQSRGLDLNHINLRRYLTEEEIAILKFVQANYELLSENNPYLKLGQSRTSSDGIRRIAEFIMNYNIPSVLRIESAGFNITNYIIAANGHFIPASCILQYAKWKLLSKNSSYDALYEVKNTKGADYVDLKMDDKEKNKSGETLNIDNLMTNEVVKGKKSLMYRFNDFTVSISELLKRI